MSLSKFPFRNLLFAALPLALIAGCATAPEGPGTNEEKEDRWNTANDPANMGRGYEYKWEALNIPELQTGASDITPWPDTYWPMMNDGYNARWLGEDVLSPMEKYDQAFNGWTPASGMATYMGYKRFKEPGTAYDDAYYDELGSAAAWAHQGGNVQAQILTQPDGTALWDTTSTDSTTPWGGLASWWGHCHAWAPAAYLDPEPIHSATANGVTFEVSDIKALIEATYEGVSSKFLGGRCNTESVKRDQFGRVIDVECRDANPGAFHVVAVNRMGIRKASFVIDATYDAEVWNQPVRDYQINKQEEVDLAKALELVGREDVADYPYSDAERFVQVEMDFRYVVEGEAAATPYTADVDDYTKTHNYKYLLELDAAGLIIGGEWLAGSHSPDFLWASGIGQDVVNPYSGRTVIKRADVESLLRLSRE